MRLSPHFTKAEAEKSQVALRRGISNSIPDVLLPPIRGVAENILEPVRAHFNQPITPSSWYRSPALNDALGGSPRSQHLKGEAVDFEVPGVSNFHVAVWIMENLDFDQLILEFFDDAEPSSGWVHVSRKHGGRQRGDVRRYDGQKYRRGLMEPV